MVKYMAFISEEHLSSILSYIRTDHYLVAFKDVGPIRQLKVRLQENPDGSYFDGWSFDQVQ